MVHNLMEKYNEKPFSNVVKCARNRYNCFNNNSDDEFDFFSDLISANSSFSDPSDTLKALY
ncbi:hypothetical protein C2S52_012918 [Perilla frutescens var. hirtella]|nr:hypothetical protein C2S52_012918 [Perilla frutescens var. hirtella]